MASLTRRGFLTKASVGAATVGVLGTSAPAFTSTATNAEVDSSEVDPAVMAEPLVAQVRNAATGELSIMSGAREFIIRDSQLVLRLLKAAG